MGRQGTVEGRGSGRAEWLTRRQVARIAGLDERRIIQMDGRELHPVRRADGSWIYEPNEIASIIRGGCISGPVTARAFSMFVAGNTEPDVVIDTQQPARRIRELRREYDEMVGSLTLDKMVVTALATALGLPTLGGANGLASAVKSALDARYRAGFLEGRADAEDYGEVTNPITGERRRITRS
jgi:hypothetical protein